MKGLAPPALPLVATPSNEGVSRNLTPLHQLGCPKPSSAIVSGLASACGGATEEGDNPANNESFGTVVAKLSAVRSDVKCIQFWIDGTIAQQVEPVQYIDISLGRLRVGKHTVSARAFDKSCVNVRQVDEYTWGSAASNIDVKAGVATRITVAMRQNSTSPASASLCFLNENESESACDSSDAGSLSDSGASVDTEASAPPIPPDAGYVDDSLPEETSNQDPNADHEWATWPIPNVPINGYPNPMSYTVDGDTTTDDVTGLIWQRIANDSAQSLDDARTYCASLRLANRTDWRLPSRIELVSILDYLRTSVSPDTDAFPNGSRSTFWSSSPAVSSPGSQWVVGAVGVSTLIRHVAVRLGDGAMALRNVRCVAAVPARPQATHYTLSHESQVVRDNWTGLEWLEPIWVAPSSGNGYCLNSTVAGGGWRLPTLPELLSIVDEKRSAPAVDSAAFPHTPASKTVVDGRTFPSLFWTASSTCWSCNAGDPLGRLIQHVDFADGSTKSYGPTNDLTPRSVRCVR